MHWLSYARTNTQCFVRFLLEWLIPHSRIESRAMSRAILDQTLSQTALKKDLLTRVVVFHLSILPIPPVIWLIWLLHLLSSILNTLYGLKAVQPLEQYKRKSKFPQRLTYLLTRSQTDLLDGLRIDLKVTDVSDCQPYCSIVFEVQTTCTIASVRLTERTPLSYSTLY
jgi:hypothetical protein